MLTNDRAARSIATCVLRRSGASATPGGATGAAKSPPAAASKSARESSRSGRGWATGRPTPSLGAIISRRWSRSPSGSRSWCAKALVTRNTAELVAHALTTQLAPLTVKTITSDNGREFAHHQQIARGLAADFFFAHPYASWERGLNENTNGLVRQYFPKKSDFAPITNAQLDHVMQRLNNRPRKTLSYKTPNEVYFKQPLVALTT